MDKTFSVPSGPLEAESTVLTSSKSKLRLTRSLYEIKTFEPA